MFVLDDFHLFTKRGRPTTLYNLLDALQAHGVQAAVVGVSADHGAVDAMEKRARSRFSHRKVIVPPPCDVTDGVEVRAASFRSRYTRAVALKRAQGPCCRRTLVCGAKLTWYRRHDADATQVTRVLHLQNSVPAVLQSMLLVDAEAAAAAASPQDAAAAASPPPAADARRQGSQRTGSGDDIAAATAAERARHMDPPCQKRHRSACDHAGAPTCSAGGSRGAGAATPSDDLADWNAAVRAAVADTDVQRTLQQLGCCSCHDLGTVCQDLCCSLLAGALAPKRNLQGPAARASSAPAIPRIATQIRTACCLPSQLQRPGLMPSLPSISHVPVDVLSARRGRRATQTANRTHSSHRRRMQRLAVAAARVRAVPRPRPHCWRRCRGTLTRRAPRSAPWRSSRSCRRISWRPPSAFRGVAPSTLRCALCIEGQPGAGCVRSARRRSDASPALNAICECCVGRRSGGQQHLSPRFTESFSRWCVPLQAIFAEYNTVRTGIRLGHEAAWAAFQGLRAQGILVAASAKTEHKTPLKRRPVLLAISGEDIRKGLGRGAGPTLALQDARGGATGGLRVEASTV